jgi:hypothetical protein
MLNLVLIVLVLKLVIIRPLLHRPLDQTGRRHHPGHRLGHVSHWIVNFLFLLYLSREMLLRGWALRLRVIPNQKGVVGIRQETMASLE